jgi:8-oxo-dGTP diphosphatase
VNTRDVRRNILERNQYENLMDGLIREIKEESGIDVMVSHLIGIYSNTATYEEHSGVKMVPTKVMFDNVCEPAGGELSTSEETSESSSSVGG